MTVRISMLSNGGQGVQAQSVDMSTVSLLDGGTGLPLNITVPAQGALYWWQIGRIVTINIALDVLEIGAPLPTAIDMVLPPAIASFDAIVAETFAQVAFGIGNAFEPGAAVVFTGFDRIQLVRLYAAVAGTLTANAYGSVAFPAATNIGVIGQIQSLLA